MKAKASNLKTAVLLLMYVAGAVVPNLATAETATPAPAAAATPEVKPPPATSTAGDESDGGSDSANTRSKGKRVREKEAEGTQAPNRFEGDTVIKSQYKSTDGQHYEVDPD